MIKEQLIGVYFLKDVSKLMILDQILEFCYSTKTAKYVHCNNIHNLIDFKMKLKHCKYNAKRPKYIRTLIYTCNDVILFGDNSKLLHINLPNL